MSERAIAYEGRKFTPSRIACALCLGFKHVWLSSAEVVEEHVVAGTETRPDGAYTKIVCPVCA